MQQHFEDQIPRESVADHTDNKLRALPCLTLLSGSQQLYINILTAAKKTKTATLRLIGQTVNKWKEKEQPKRVLSRFLISQN